MLVMAAIMSWGPRKLKDMPLTYVVITSLNPEWSAWWRAHNSFADCIKEINTQAAPNIKVDDFSTISCRMAGARNLKSPSTRIYQ